MTSAQWLQLGIAFVLMIFAGLTAAAEAALSSFSRPANRLVEEGGRGTTTPEDRRGPTAIPEYGTFCAQHDRDLGDYSGRQCDLFSHLKDVAGRCRHCRHHDHRLIHRWGVAPAHWAASTRTGSPARRRTDRGDHHRARAISATAHHDRERADPGKGFTEGPFATEAELRELVDLAEASEVIESGERKMIHSVFDLGDTIVREVMVPRTDMVFIEEYKTLRQAVSLALRSGFSRIPVIRDGIDDVVGVLYLKDVIRRIYDKPDAQSTERVGSLMRKPVSAPTPSPQTNCCRRCRPSGCTWRSWWTSSVAQPGW